MKAPRQVALALVAFAALVYFALTARWNDAAAARAAQDDRLRAEQRTLLRQLAPLERRAELRARASTLVGRSTSARPSEEAVHQVRRRIVVALTRAGHYRLDVRRGAAGTLASVALATDGGFLEMVDLVSTLSAPGSGLVLQQVVLAPAPPRVALQFEAVALGGVP
jgi:hypothetical protein